MSTEITGHLPVALNIYSNSIDKSKRGFPAESKNKRTNETGLNWATGMYEWAEDADGKSIRDENGRHVKLKGAVSQFQVDNVPVSAILESLEIRGEGGRAYKVRVPELSNLYFDLREDQLMATILEAGIEKGGLLKGKYVFGVAGSQMKLILVGSQLHKNMILSTKERGKKKLTKLIPGNSYQSRTKTKLYLGRINKQYIFYDYCYNDKDDENFRLYQLSIQKSKGSWITDLGVVETHTNFDIDDVVDLTAKSLQAIIAHDEKRYEADKKSNGTWNSGHWSNHLLSLVRDAKTEYKTVMAKLGVEVL